MKKHHLLFALFLFPILTRAQVNFLPISFDEAVKQSSQSGMMIFLQFESEECSRCNEVADKSFETKEVGDLLNQAFICIKINADSRDRNAVKELYNIKGFGSYIIDQNKTLIHSYPASTTNSKEYLKQVDLALNKAGEDIRINELQKQYAANKNPDLLELLLLKKRSLNFETDSLLDEYVSIITPDSLKSTRVIVFIAQMAPLLGSKADITMRKDYNLFTRAWFTMDLNTRVAANNRMIYKSLAKAIKEKNEQFAYKVANFARATHNTSSEAGQKAFESNMLNYYKETNDSLNYLIRAVYYYDNYYMRLSPDSVKNRDSVRKNVLVSQAQMVKSTSNNGTITATTNIRFAPAGQFLARDLNEGAWTIYKMTGEPLYLQKALQWSKKAIDFWPSPESLDTWARLLYKSGKKSEAIAKQEEAVALQKKQGFNTKEYEATLGKMKKGSALD